ncbi:HAD-IIIA family hydrolase [Candidatus Acetothermia bacterium]|jgi:HAD superfamily phosphatase (TIGR01668 family)|nr:HAD-IIIA family hydrolase [Candidatus Acetothermia bacterium]MCI2427326.1 HAD-IIIA family hydrolase [Candidatus Acetothermia bacterium]MCI2428499.1 HAD-IIIA family hydrolase [Candidatus Acetothermia bacterium]
MSAAKIDFRNLLPNRFQPQASVPTIFDIDFEYLWNQGKRALIFDLDRTLAAHRRANLHPQVYRLLNSLQERGFAVAILTNRRFWVKQDQLIAELAQRYPLICAAGKPGKEGFLTLMAKMNVTPADTVMIGDRLLTDIWGANRLGIYSIRIDRKPRLTKLF